MLLSSPFLGPVQPVVLFMSSPKRGAIIYLFLIKFNNCTGNVLTLLFIA